MGSGTTPSPHMSPNSKLLLFDGPLGALDPFADAVDVLEKLTLLHVCATSGREATEALGETIATTEEEEGAAAWEPTVQQLPPPPTRVPERLSISMDGTMVHPESDAWRELTLGAT